MFNTLGHKGNANRNYIEIPSHTNQNGYHQENTKNNVDEYEGKRESSLHCWWEYKLV
jgi:hypothetical protein